MKSLVSLLIIWAITCPTLFAQTASLDADFDADGIVTTDWAGDYDAVEALIVQSDGKILAAGHANSSSSMADFAIARYNPDGSLDLTFSFDGKVTTDLGSGNEGVRAIALQTDGKIVVAGYTYQSGMKGGIARYNSDGTLDLSFNSTGKMVVSPGGNDAELDAMVIQNDGKILVGGYTKTTPYPDFFLMRLHPDGSPDSTFGWTGSVTTDFSNYSDRIYALAVQSDGKIVATGWSQNQSQNAVGVARYLANGQPDSTFSIDGKLIDVIGTSINIGKAVHVFPDGKILVAVRHSTISAFSIGLIQYLPGGGYDASFGNGGFVDTTFGGFSTFVEGMVVEPTGRILVGGRVDVNNDDDFFLAGFLSDGTPDRSIFPTGMIATDLLGPEDYAYAVARQPNGRVLVGGATYNGNDDDFGLVRYLTGPDVGLLDLQAFDGQVWVYPNPINTAPRLRFSLEKPEKITVSLLDLQGQELSQPLPSVQLSAGEHDLSLPVPEGLARGIYLVKIAGEEGILFLRMQK